jgi:hypothetical protein
MAVQTSKGREAARDLLMERRDQRMKLYRKERRVGKSGQDL